MSTGWNILSVIAATCCVLPYTMISNHLKRSRARNLDMKKGYMMTITAIVMGLIIITIFAVGANND